MSRSVATLVSIALLAFGLFSLVSSGSTSGEIGAPPEQLVQFDEEATAQFNQDAAVRRNIDQVTVVLAITLGLTGVIVVGVGHFGEPSE